MSLISINYNDLTKASKNAKDAAKELDEYKSKIQNGISKKISNIRGSSSKDINEALSLTNDKVKQLKTKKEKFENFAKKIDKYKEKVKETDAKVAREIESITNDFAEINKIKISITSRIVCGISEALNSSSFGRWVKNTYNKAKEKVSEWKSEFDHWFKTCGGKFIKDICLSVVAIGAAAFTLLTVGTGVVATILGIGAIFTIVNAITDICYSVKAINASKDDPAWAHRYGKIDKATDAIRLKTNSKYFDFAADILDIAESFTIIVGGVKGIKDAGKSLIELGKGKGLNSLKNLFGQNEGSFGLIRNKFSSGTAQNNKITISSFYDGLKSIKSDVNFKNGIKDNSKLFINEIKGILKRGKKNIKESFSVDVNKMTAARANIKQFIVNRKDEVIKTFSFKGEAYNKDYEKLNNAKLFGKRTNLNFEKNIKIFGKDFTLEGKDIQKGLTGIKRIDSIYSKLDKDYRKTFNKVFMPDIDSIVSKSQSIGKEFKKIVFN